MSERENAAEPTRDGMCRAWIKRSWPCKAWRYWRTHGRLPDLSVWRARWREKMPAPVRLQIEPTTLCNLSCETCTHADLPADRRGQNMSFDFFRRIIESVPSAREIKLQGLGEPLMAPDFLRMLEWGFEHGFRFDVITNGTLPAQKYLQTFPMISRLAFSLDSVSEETLRTLRRGADLARIRKTIECVVEAKRRSNWPGVCGVNCVVSNDNWEEMPAMMRWVQEVGVDFLNLVAVENWKTDGEPGFEKSEAYCSKARKVVDMSVLREVYERGAWSFKLGLQDASPRKGHCCWCFTTAYITCDGFVTPCCIRSDPRVKQFGNLCEETFEAVWNNEAMREFRRSHLHGAANPVCDRCPD